MLCIFWTHGEFFSQMSDVNRIVKKLNPKYKSRYISSPDSSSSVLVKATDSLGSQGRALRSWQGPGHAGLRYIPLSAEKTMEPGAHSLSCHLSPLPPPQLTNPSLFPPEVRHTWDGPGHWTEIGRKPLTFSQ